jgi:hypothetical protein
MVSGVESRYDELVVVTFLPHTTKESPFLRTGCCPQPPPSRAHEYSRTFRFDGAQSLAQYPVPSRHQSQQAGLPENFRHQCVATVQVSKLNMPESQENWLVQVLTPGLMARNVKPSDACSCAYCTFSIFNAALEIL